MKIGVIAEDKSDVEVLYEFTCKLISENSFSFRKFVGRGSGKFRSKCKPWAENLLRAGCQYLIVLHDLDHNDEDMLRNDLESLVRDICYKSFVVLIPKQEIEAWLLTDANALKSVFNLSRAPKLPSDPESVDKPKEWLASTIWTTGKKRYINTLHNRRIASACDLSEMKKCRSFEPFPEFVKAHLQG